MSVVERAYEIIGSHGYGELIRRMPRYIYKKSIRCLLPSTGYYRKSGIPYRIKKPLDFFFFPHWSDDPAYECALIASVREEVEAKDDVGVIGGGLGISAVAAATCTGASGTVVVYEASADRVESIHRVVRLNDLEDIVQVEHGLVGPNVRVYGELGNPSPVHPANLPRFDVLEMDCEGAELEILRELSHLPRTIIVEVHPPNVSEQDVRETLQENGYEISERMWENEGTENPLPVLTARLRGVSSA